jgi:hypothetical protein
LPTNKIRLKNSAMKEKLTQSISGQYVLPIYESLRKNIVGIASAILFLLASNSTLSAQVVINELGIAPDISVCDGDQAKGGEFIELFNKGCASVDISCNVILFVGVTGTGSPEGWTITIPAGTVLPSCGYYVIGGSGKAFGSGGGGWGASGVGGTAWINPLGPVNLDISTSSTTSLGGNQPGNLVDKQGEVYFHLYLIISLSLVQQAIIPAFPMVAQQVADPLIRSMPIPILQTM